MPVVNEILENRQLSELVNLYRVYAPEIAHSRKAGQFVIVRLDEQGERIPLTIADADPEAGTLTLVVQAVGKSTRRMAGLQAGEKLLDLVGPLGAPTHIENFGRVAVIGGGIGIAPAHPIAQALKSAGNHVTTILGARMKELIFFEEEMGACSDESIVCTDDGSYGQKGLVTDVLRALVEKHGKYDLVVAIGPLVMMKFTALLTKELGIPTVVSLNPIMIDGTGMCGGCRVTVGGETKFVCVDGPEFDGHQVDFDNMMQRLGAYAEREQKVHDAWHEHQCACESHDTSGH